MISYGGQMSTRPTYLRQGMTEISKSLHYVDEGGVVLMQTEDLLTRTIVSTESAPLRWTDVCAAFVASRNVAYASLTPVNEQGFAPLYRAGDESPMAPLGPELLATLLAKQSKSFVVDATLANGHAGLHSGFERSCSSPLDFGLDGVWLMRLKRTAQQPVFDEADVAELKPDRAALEAAARTSRTLIKSAITTRLNIHQQLSIPFALLDSTGHIVSCNTTFLKMSHAYFTQNNGASLPLGPADAKAFKDALKSLNQGAEVCELALKHETSPCVVSLKPTPESKLRLSQAKLFSLTLRGVMTPRVLQPKLLAALFGLTSREADVTSLLAFGMSVNKIAEAHHVAVGTIRVQLKAIYRKLSVSSQIELVAKLQSSGI